jgi:hypothetical protein
MRSVGLPGESRSCESCRMQNPMHHSWDCRNPPYDPDEPGPSDPATAMETARRENYDSGEHFVLEYGELRFTFNETDFSERCEQAALKLGFVGGRLGEAELEDLVNLAVNGEIIEPASELGEHVNECWPELIGPAERSLVHWLRRLVFRGAWLDQRVKEGELSVAYDEQSGTFAYVQPAEPGAGAGGGEAIELAPEPPWGRVAYRR